MQKRVTITERRECNPRGVEGAGAGRRLRRRVSPVLRVEEGSFFCGLVLAQQQCPGQVVPQTELC